MKVLFGPAGQGDSFKKNKNKGVETYPNYLNEVGLTAFEYQCGRGVKISKEKCEILKNAAQKNGISISLHAPYYISLSSTDKSKRDKSIDYIIQSADAAKNMGANRIIVHSGSCGKLERSEALELAKDTISRALIELKENNLDDIVICPETMGKINQLGNLKEVLELCKIDDKLIPCIDFGHLNARTNGSIKEQIDYLQILDLIENEIGYDRCKVFHSHFSKIKYTEKGGEVEHLTFDDDVYGPDFEPLAELIAKKNISPTFICESAGTQIEDALTMKSSYEKFL